MNLKCIKCNTPTKKAITARNYFKKFKIEGINIEKCPKCGEEYLDEEEYERIRIKLEKIIKEIKPIKSGIKQIVI